MLHPKHKTKDLDTVLIRQKCIPTNFDAKHVRGHQDWRKRKDLLTSTEGLNIQADQIVGANANTHEKINIKNATIAVYVNEVYTPNNYAKVIKSRLGTQKARELLQEKYQWTKAIINNIERKLHANFI